MKDDISELPYRIMKGTVRTISNKTKYGLQALTILAQRYGEGPVLIATLAKDEDIPIKFLELILLDLKNAGILESKKGPGGGYFLSKPPEKTTVGSVFRMMEGPLAGFRETYKDAADLLQRYKRNIFLEATA